MDTRPTWELVLDSASRLTRSGTVPFSLAELVTEVQQLDPWRERPSIQPVVQGMTINATGGPPSPCGKPLERVRHGYYRLGDEQPDVRAAAHTERPRHTTTPRRRSTSRPGRREHVLARVHGLIASFDDAATLYDGDPPFVRRGQLEFHMRTIERRREVGTAAAAVADKRFCELLYETLRAWGVGRRASRLVDLTEFRQRLEAHGEEFEALDGFALEDPSLALEAVADRVDDLICELGIVHNQAVIVAGTKALHHLLPSLVPPMDRAWTGAFFGWNVVDPQNRHSAIFREAFSALAIVAVACRPSRLVADGWRTSSTKILDNALIGYCKQHGIGGGS